MLAWPLLSRRVADDAVYGADACSDRDPGEKRCPVSLRLPRQPPIPCVQAETEYRWTHTRLSTGEQDEDNHATPLDTKQLSGCRQTHKSCN